MNFSNFVGHANHASHAFSQFISVNSVPKDLPLGVTLFFIIDHLSQDVLGLSHLRSPRTRLPILI